MTTLADYTGRSIDVAAYVGVVEAGEALLTQELAGPSNFGQIITGAQKVAQRFLLRLFTIRGTLLYSPEEGCDFMRDVLEGRLQTVPDVFSSFAAAMVDIQGSFSEEATEDDPADEVFADATLVNVELAGDKLTMLIELQIASGETLPIILPLPVVI